ncbi:MAG: pentapeptide repeat-containing protein [Candidatus Yanofskybacteria bacterium]|nr:pentapeptide repeat-containing protein [Candidatus Yanofskybacteria bacterium]
MSVEIKNLDGEVVFVFPGDSLVEANLSNNKNLGRADFRGQDMRNVNLGGAHCRGADFSGADMSGQKTCLVYAQCQDAKFVGTNLEGADMERINICGADLTGARKNGARTSYWHWDEDTKF